MRVVLTDGTELPCTNFKAIDSGVLLTKDKKRKKVIGFVPHREVKYVVPDDMEVERAAGFGFGPADRADAVETGDVDGADGDGERDSRDSDALLVTGPTADTARDESQFEESTDPEATAVDQPDAEADVPAGSDLRRLGGLGSTYADRLRAAGYGTLADLAAADPVAVAEAASVPPGRARRWVDAAVRRTTPSESDQPDEPDEPDQPDEPDGPDQPDGTSDAVSAAHESEGDEGADDDPESVDERSMGDTGGDTDGGTESDAGDDEE